jgi:transcription antitermination factor NusG
VNSSILQHEHCPADRPQWFAVWTAPRHERRVAERMEDRGLNVFLPFSKQTRLWKKRAPVELEIPLFAGYVFVRARYAEKGRVITTPGVKSLVGNGKDSIAIPDCEMEALRKGLHLYDPQPHPMLTVGDRVLIKHGPLAGLEGVLVRKKRGARVVITVRTIMQAVSIEVGFDQLADVASKETVRSDGSYRAN